MSFISLEEAKSYLRVDSSGEDVLIGALLDSAFRLCADVARLGDEQRMALEHGDSGDDSDMLRIAVLYALGYLYEHREEGDHHGLTLTLRSLLFGIREGVF